MTNLELKQDAKDQFELNAGDASERVKWSQVLATCLQTEVMVELNGNLLDAIDRI